MSVIDGRTGRARFLLVIVLLFLGCVAFGFLVPRFHEKAAFLVVLCGYVFLVVPVAFWDTGTKRARRRYRRVAFRNARQVANISAKCVGGLYAIFRLLTLAVTSAVSLAKLEHPAPHPSGWQLALIVGLVALEVALYATVAWCAGGMISFLWTSFIIARRRRAGIAATKTFK